MESTDLKLAGKKKIGRKRSKWSYKANGPGRRYMILREGKGIIRRIWGGYSPKRHDGTFLSDNKEELDNSLVGGVILADNHFYTNFSLLI